MTDHTNSNSDKFTSDNNSAADSEPSEEMIPDLITQMSDLPRSRREFLHDATKVGAGTAALGAVGSGVAAAHRGDGNSSYAEQVDLGYAPLSDLQILKFALLLERLEASFYTQAVGTAPVGEGGGPDLDNDLEYNYNYDYEGQGGRASGRLSEFAIESSDAVLQFDAEQRNATFEYFQRIRDHEQAHVDALAQVIESVTGEPAPYNDVEFTFSYDTAEEFLKLAQTLEDTGTGAYTAAAPFIDNPTYLASAAQILAVEARHASYLRVLSPTARVPFPRAFQQKLSVSTVKDRVEPFIDGDLFPLFES